MFWFFIPIEPIIAVRRVSQPLVAPDEPETSSRTLSPPRRPVSCVVHVMNLVRPFTVSQLKQLLGRTGKLIESGFWINSIKSHCYVTVSICSCSQDFLVWLEGTNIRLAYSSTVFNIWFLNCTTKIHCTHSAII